MAKTYCSEVQTTYLILGGVGISRFERLTKWRPRLCWRIVTGL